MKRDQGRDLEKSKSKCGNHAVPPCDTNTITVMHGMSVNQQYSCASIYGKTDYLDQWFPNCVHRG